MYPSSQIGDVHARSLLRRATASEHGLGAHQLANLASVLLQAPHDDDTTVLLGTAPSSSSPSRPEDEFPLGRRAEGACKQLVLQQRSQLANGTLSLARFVTTDERAPDTPPPPPPKPVPKPTRAKSAAVIAREELAREMLRQNDALRRTCAARTLHSNSVIR